jgi:hypothetical protein
MHDDEEQAEQDRGKHAPARTAVASGDEARRIMANLGISMPCLEDDRFWRQRDAEIEAQKLAELDRAIADRLDQRAHAMKDNLGEMLFPDLAVDNALAILRGKGFSTPALERVRDFKEARRISLELAGGVGLRTALALSGGIGSGKSTAAAWFFLIGNDHSPGFIRSTELEARGRYDNSLRAWLRTRSSLLIDDIGAEPLARGGGVFASLLGEVVDMYYGDRKPLIMTTNLRRRRRTADEEPQFVERYGERIGSRMSEVGGWADCGAVDLRTGARP